MKDSTKRSLRTVAQALAGIGTALPGLLSSSGLDEMAPWLAQAAVVAGVAARVMAAPAVQRWLPRWLRIDGPDADLEALARRGRP